MRFNKLLIFLPLALLLSSCAAKINTEYSRRYTSSVSISEPIYLSFPNSKGIPYYFILKHKAPSNSYELRVRWTTPYPDSIFDSANSSIKFLINNKQLLRLNLAKHPKIISYGFDGAHEEEALFLLDENNMRQIAFAKKVQVELVGKDVIVSGNFNERQTFRSFRKFLEN